MTKKQSTRKGSTKGRAEGGKQKVTAEQAAQIEAEAEGFKQAAHDYATKAYTAALAHFEANQSNPFALSRLGVVYGEQALGDFNLVVTLPGSERDRAVTDALLRRWCAQVEMLCRTLEHPHCSDAFRGAFGAIFTDHVLDGGGASWTTPAVVRVMLPLALLEMSSCADGDPDQMIGILATLREELNDDATAEEVRAAVFGV